MALKSEPRNRGPVPDPAGWWRSERSGAGGCGSNAGGPFGCRGGPPINGLDSPTGNCKTFGVDTLLLVSVRRGSAPPSGAHPNPMDLMEEDAFARDLLDREELPGRCCRRCGRRAVEMGKAVVVVLEFLLSRWKW